MEKSAVGVAICILSCFKFSATWGFGSVHHCAAAAAHSAAFGAIAVMFMYRPGFCDKLGTISDPSPWTPKERIAFVEAASEM